MDKDSSAISSALYTAELKKSGLRNALQHLQERSSSLLLISLQWKDLEEHYEATHKALERRAAQLRSLEDSLRETHSAFEARLGEMERREKEFASRVRLRIEERCREGERCARQLEIAKIDIAARLKEVEEMERRFVVVTASVELMVSERLRDVEEREKRLDFREKQIEASKRKLDEKTRAVDLKDKEFENRAKNLQVKEKELDERVQQDRLKEKMLEEWSVEIGSKNRELSRRIKETDSRDNRTQENLEEPESSRGNKCGEQNDAVVSAEDRVLKLNDNILAEVKAEPEPEPLHIGTNLQIFLNEHWKEHDTLRGEVSGILRRSADPAKLVLDAMEGFYPPRLRKGSTEFGANIVMKSCILLLEQLMKISPTVLPEVKAEAIRLSFSWRTKMRAVNGGHPLEVLGFLQVLASYDLAYAFNRDELMENVEKVAHFSHMPELCRVLGLKDRIPGLVKNLVEKKQHHVAVRFVNAFKIDEEFPPVLLLKDDDRISKSAAGAILRNGSNSPEAQNQTMRRVAQLEARSKCIGDHNVMLTVPPETSKQDVDTIVKQNGEQKEVAAEAGLPVKIREFDNVGVSSMVAACVMSPTAVSAKTTTATAIETAISSEPETSMQYDNPHTAVMTEGGLEVRGGTTSTHSAQKKTDLLAHQVTSSENLCSSPNVKDLRMLLNGDVEYEMVRDEVSTSLRSSADPANLVLETVKGSVPPVLGTDEGFKLGIPVKCCILLLEHLQRFSPVIRPQIIKEAKQCAVIWKSKLKSRKDHMEVICFLLFLAVFKLAPSFDASSVVCLLDASDWCICVPKSCKLLGLADFLPGFIQNLVEKKHWLDAITYIGALRMVDKFPLAPLLNEYLAYWKNRADESCRTKGSSPAVQIEAIETKLSAMRTAIKFVGLYRLMSEISLEELEANIEKLEKQKAETSRKNEDPEVGHFSGSNPGLMLQDTKDKLLVQSTGNCDITKCANAARTVNPQVQCTSSCDITKCANAPRTVTASSTSVMSTSATTRSKPQKRHVNKRKHKAEKSCKDEDPEVGHVSGSNLGLTPYDAKDGLPVQSTSNRDITMCANATMTVTMSSPAVIKTSESTGTSKLPKKHVNKRKKIFLPPEAPWTGYARSGPTSSHYSVRLQKWRPKRQRNTFRRQIDHDLCPPGSPGDYGMASPSDLYHDRDNPRYAVETYQHGPCGGQPVQYTDPGDAYRCPRW